MIKSIIHGEYGLQAATLPLDASKNLIPSRSQRLLACIALTRYINVVVGFWIVDLPHHLPAYYTLLKAISISVYMVGAVGKGAPEGCRVLPVSVVNVPKSQVFPRRDTSSLIGID